MAEDKVKVPPFDPDKNHGTIVGSNLAAWVQNGIYYDRAGNALDMKTGQIILYKDELEVEEEEAPEVVVELRLEDTPWAEIKAAVEEAGGTYTNKREGIAFLRSLSSS